MASNLEFDWGSPIFEKISERRKVADLYGFRQPWDLTGPLTAGRYRDFTLAELPLKENGKTNTPLPVMRSIYNLALFRGGKKGREFATFIAQERIHPYFILGPKSGTQRRNDRSLWGLATNEWDRDAMGSGWLAASIKDFRTLFNETDITPGQVITFIQGKDKEHVSYFIDKATRPQRWVLNSDIASYVEKTKQDLNGGRIYFVKDEQTGKDVPHVTDGVIREDGREMRKFIPAAYQLWENKKLRGLEEERVRRTGQRTDPRVVASAFIPQEVMNEIDLVCDTAVNEDTLNTRRIMEIALGNEKTPVYEMIQRTIGIETARFTYGYRPAEATPPPISPEAFKELIRTMQSAEGRGSYFSRFGGEDPMAAYAVFMKNAMRMMVPDISSQAKIDTRARKNWLDANNFGDIENPGNTGVMPRAAIGMWDRISGKMGRSEGAGMFGSMNDRLSIYNLEGMRSNLTEIVEDAPHIDALKTMAMLYDRKSGGRGGIYKNVEAAINGLAGKMTDHPENLGLLLLTASHLRAYQGIAGNLARIPGFNDILDPGDPTTGRRGDDAGMMTMIQLHAKDLEYQIYRTIAQHFLSGVETKKEFLLSKSEAHYKQFAFFLEWAACEAPDVLTHTTITNGGTRTIASTVADILPEANIGFTSEPYNLDMVDMMVNVRNYTMPEYVPNPKYGQPLFDPNTRKPILDPATNAQAIDKRFRLRKKINAHGVQESADVKALREGIEDHLYRVATYTINNKLSPVKHVACPDYAKEDPGLVAYLKRNEGVVEISMHGLTNQRLEQLASGPLMTQMQMTIDNMHQVAVPYNLSARPTPERRRYDSLKLAVKHILAALENGKADPQTIQDLKNKLSEMDTALNSATQEQSKYTRRGPTATP